ncbi:hypothetical protein M5689_009354 [Euphorbia peplus]|nr:hypothetical protein M5689_009354 [Euphorbia peplus]
MAPPSSSSSSSASSIESQPNPSSPRPRIRQPSNYSIARTNLPLMELDSPFQASQILTTMGQRSESAIGRRQWNRWNPPQNHIAMLASSIPFGATEQQFQELLNQAGGGQLNLYPMSSNPYHFQHHSLIQPMLENSLAQGSRPPLMNNWISEGQQGIEHSALGAPIPRYQRNTVYDPMYETIGLPVDPHLRMFAARRGN